MVRRKSTVKIVTRRFLQTCLIGVLVGVPISLQVQRRSSAVEQVADVPQLDTTVGPCLRSCSRCRTLLPTPVPTKSRRSSPSLPATLHTAHCPYCQKQAIVRRTPLLAANAASNPAGRPDRPTCTSCNSNNTFDKGTRAQAAAAWQYLSSRDRFLVHATALLPLRYLQAVETCCVSCRVRWLLPGTGVRQCQRCFSLHDSSGGRACPCLGTLDASGAAALGRGADRWLRDRIGRPSASLFPSSLSVADTDTFAALLKQDDASSLVHGRIDERSVLSLARQAVQRARRVSLGTGRWSGSVWLRSDLGHATAASEIVHQSVHAMLAEDAGRLVGGRLPVFLEESSAVLLSYLFLHDCLSSPTARQSYLGPVPAALIRREIRRMELVSDKLYGTEWRTGIAALARGASRRQVLSAVERSGSFLG